MTKTTNKQSFEQVVVVGTSAGGQEALVALIKQLPADFPAPILMVMHLSADANAQFIMDVIQKSSQLSCKMAEDKELLRPAQVYLAPSDHHLMIGKNGEILVTKGAQENRSRPGIDPLFRSAAVAYRNRVIGIVLTGYLDDGTAGLLAIQRCGGICIVQNPDEASYPDMPRNALNQIDVDYCLNIIEMGSILAQLMNRKLPKEANVPEDIFREATIAERVLSDLPSVNSLGDQVPFNCPGCGGVLWKIGKGPMLRYRCHTGHAYTAQVLLAEQTSKIEETMWIALRMFEERRNLLVTMAKDKTGTSAKVATERANHSQVHIDRIRAILLSDNPGEDESLAD
ncbi:two-component system chemotaxis response regulator CheB [Pedobacter sp. CAN_A7]|uniref:chemotaxis protein CheB n=1 Tax=Pedobacter sp. CAN_A7 TaxID=2787722 RepID=UPI0018C98075